MDKSILIQYCDIREEIKEVRKRIERLEEEIEKMEESGYVVTDSVKGGSGGIQNYKITGFPYGQYSRKKTLLCVRKATLETLEMDLLEATNSAEEFIHSLQDSKMRRILTMRFIDDLSYDQIGRTMNYDRTSISKKIDKFFEE